ASGSDDNIDWNKLLNSGVPATAERASRLPPTLMSESSPVTVANNAAATAVAEAATRSEAAPQPANTFDLAPMAATTAAPAVVKVDAPDRAAPAAAGRTYTVKDGESYWTIAASQYGSGSYVGHLQRANPLVEPKRLRPGMVINLPDPSDVKPDSAKNVARTVAMASAAQASSSATVVTPGGSKGEYKVQNNDTLYRICVKLYGSPRKVDALYDFNRATIGPDAGRLKPGMVLQLPEAPR
ncbi:MAG TPA: LysM domain-containing protein, partial [Tepidisphaeraceae bacterium]|nr:LysM domain-containing protein [Tepidisphaeraceae bacterium]